MSNANGMKRKMVATGLVLVWTLVVLFCSLHAGRLQTNHNQETESKNGGPYIAVTQRIARKDFSFYGPYEVRKFCIECDKPVFDIIKTKWICEFCGHDYNESLPDIKRVVGRVLYTIKEGEPLYKTWGQWVPKEESGDEDHPSTFTLPIEEKK